MTEQAGSSNGGQRSSLNADFHSRRGWPRRSRGFYGYAHDDISAWLEAGFFCPQGFVAPFRAWA
jgi:hypothetical protein